jgi:hypothetical protein
LPSASLSEFVRGLSSDPGANGAAGCRLPESTCHLETKPALAPFHQIGRSEVWRPWQLFWPLVSLWTKGTRLAIRMNALVERMAQRLSDRRGNAALTSWRSESDRSR